MSAGRLGGVGPAGSAGRVGRVDVLRALAALAVLAGHAYELGGRGIPIRAQRWYDVPLIGTTSGVWLFFAISGYVIARPWIDALATGRELPDMRGYALRRIARIFPLYWLALTAFLLIEGRQGATGLELIAHYLLVNNLIPGRQEALLPVAWTLTLEVLFYVAVPLLALAARGRSPRKLLILLALSWVASILVAVAGDLLGDGKIGLWLRGSLPAMWQMFCPGILLALVPHLGGRLPGALRRLTGPLRSAEGRTGAAAAAALLLTALLVSALAPLRYGIVPYQLFVDSTRPLFAVGFGLVLAGALRPSRRDPARWLLELGIASYGIYLIHPIVIDFILNHPSLRPFSGASLGASAVHLTVIAAVTIALALLSWRLLERPAIALARAAAGGRGAGMRKRGADGAERDPGMAEGDPAMRDYWNARAREDAFYFVDTRQRYRDTDRGRFWDAAELLDYVLEGLGVSLEPRSRVLEIGCGVGRITRVLADQAREVVALDVSDEMLRIAAVENPELANVTWTLGDGRTLAPLDDASVDACVSLVVLQHVPDASITLGYVRELGRVLAPGGWAALQVSNDPAVHRPRTPLGWRLKALVGRAPRGQHHPAWLGSWVDLGELRGAAASSGLITERVWGEGSQYCQVLLRRR